MPRDRYFLRIYVGPSPMSARPVVATEDRAVLRAAVQALLARLPSPVEAEPAPGTQWDAPAPSAPVGRSAHG